MKETNFKVLMHMGSYVDTTLLGKGIYACNKPSIYSIDETIESLTEKYRTVQNMTEAMFINEAYFDNLKQCELVPVVITEAAAKALFIEDLKKELAGDKNLLIAEIREAFAYYRKSEGCSCCQDTNAHEKAESRLAELLGAAMYEDSSGVNWEQYIPKPIES